MRPLRPRRPPGGGLDDNCDEQVDEGFGSVECGVGQCLHTVDFCSGGETQFCNPFEGAGAEVCDGEDNDCDGEVDEELAGVQEVCNELDDNCDGQVDFCDAGSLAFNYTGGVQTFVVVEGCPNVTVKAWGAGGGSGGRNGSEGGGGAFASSILNLEPGVTYQVIVAGAGGKGGGGGASIGDVVLKGSGWTPGGTDDPDYDGQSGWGADNPYNGAAGKNGLIVISWE